MSYIDIDYGADKARAEELLSTNFANTVLAGVPETDEDYASGVIVSARQNTFEADQLPEPDRVCDDGLTTIKMWYLVGATVYIIDGEAERGLYIHKANSNLIDIFENWDFGDMDYYEGVASFGFNCPPDEVQGDALNVRVWVQRQYYRGTLSGSTRPHYLRDGNNDYRRFATTGDAQKWIDKQEAQIYYLAHGEHSRPIYTIVE